MWERWWGTFRKKWTNEVVSPDEIHTIPLGDKVLHTADEDCICKPRCEPIQRNDGSFGWLYFHPAADGRE